MAAYIKAKRSGASTASVRGTEESPFFKWLLISIDLLFALVFLLLPLINVFAQALHKGWTVYWQALSDPDSKTAIKLTLLVAAISVPLNVLFGLASAWAIAKFSFRGKSLLNTLIDLPFSVSPVVAGLMVVLVFGIQGEFGAVVFDPHIKVYLCRARHRAGDIVCDISVCGAGIGSGNGIDRVRTGTSGADARS